MNKDELDKLRYDAETAIGMYLSTGQQSSDGVNALAAALIKSMYQKRIITKELKHLAHRWQQWRWYFNSSGDANADKDLITTYLRLIYLALEIRFYRERNTGRTYVTFDNVRYRDELAQLSIDMKRDRENYNATA